MPEITTPPPMMKCGHAANAVSTRAGSTESVPSCVICSCFDQAETAPDLTGRTARCSYYAKRCHNEAPSTLTLAFFGHHPDRDFDEYYCGCYGWN